MCGISRPFSLRELFKVIKAINLSLDVLEYAFFPFVDRIFIRGSRLLQVM